MLQILVPYREHGAFNAVRRRFNRMLSSTRQVVERAFGNVKTKFQRLKCFRSYSIEYAVDHIVACFVLHDFILLEGVPYNQVCRYFTHDIHRALGKFNGLRVLLCL